MMIKQDKLKINFASKKWLLNIMLGCFFLWLVLAALSKWYHTVDSNMSSSFGDTLGIVTSLFTALAFGGLLYTVFLQKQELQETREVLLLQSKTMDEQRFETTFFNLLTSYFNVRDTLRFKDQEGLNVIRKVVQILNSNAMTSRIHQSQQNSIIYNASLKDYEGPINGYIQMMICLYDFILDTKGIDSEKYIRIFRSFLSSSETDLIGHYITRMNNERYSIKMFKDVVVEMSYSKDLNTHEAPRG